ncbi:phosphopantetheine-binding protein [Rhodococcus sp. 3Y1]
MVPASVMVSSDMPLSPAGKLDQRPAPVFETKEFRAPVTEMEQILSEIFADVLGLDRIGTDDSFFAQGGDSIMSIQLVSRAKARGVVFAPSDVFESKTVAALAEVAKYAADVEAAVVLEVAGRWSRLDAVDADRTIHGRARWQLQPIHTDDDSRASTGVQRADIVRTLAAVVDHHDMFRSRLISDGRGWGCRSRARNRGRRGSAQPRRCRRGCGRVDNCSHGFQGPRRGSRPVESGGRRNGSVRVGRLRSHSHRALDHRCTSPDRRRGL